MSQRFAFLAEPDLARVLALLNPPGEETRVVGGAVRGALIGLAPSDFDLATTLLPDAVMQLAESARLRAIPTGIAHGTVTLVAGGQAFEVTTLREDIASDGRHAKVRFGRSFVADALRRDFTINALSVSPDGRLHDYTGGQADLAARRVRFIGDPARRIAEDFLRALRFFRFHAAFGAGEPDAAALAAILQARQGLPGLSRERVRMELFKLLSAPGAAGAAQAMSDMDIFGILLGGVTAPARLARLMVPGGADPLLRLAALALWTGEDAERLGERLRLSRLETAHLAEIAAVRAAWHGAAQPPGVADLQRLLLLHGHSATADGLALVQAEGFGQAGSWPQAFALLASLPRPRLPFSGADLRQRGIEAGPKMGAMLKTLQARWIRAGFPKDPAELARLLAEVVEQS